VDVNRPASASGEISLHFTLSSSKAISYGSGRKTERRLRFIRSWSVPLCFRKPSSAHFLPASVDCCPFGRWGFVGPSVPLHYVASVGVGRGGPPLVPSTPIAFPPGLFFPPVGYFPAACLPALCVLLVRLSLSFPFLVWSRFNWKRGSYGGNAPRSRSVFTLRRRAECGTLASRKSSRLGSTVLVSRLPPSASYFWMYCAPTTPPSTT